MSPTELEYDSTPQWSDDRAHWWDGQQWIPAQEAKAKANALAAVSPDARPAYLPPADPPSRSSFVRRQLIIGGSVLLVLLLVLGIAELSRGGKTLTPAQQVTKALVAASTAEHANLVAKKTFTGDFQELGAAGYKGEKGVALTVIRADRRAYCLQGLKGTVTLYVSGDTETEAPAVTTEPCS
jgi:hypothetical protein